MELVVVTWLPSRAISITKFGGWMVISCFFSFQALMNCFLASLCFISRWVASSCILLLQDGVVYSQGEFSVAQREYFLHLFRGDYFIFGLVSHCCYVIVISM